MSEAAKKATAEAFDFDRCIVDYTTREWYDYPV